MRIVALLQVYNERRFIRACIEHLVEEGVDVYLIDNESTDETLAIAEEYLGKGVIGIESLPRHGVFELRNQCRRQEQLAASLDADWFIHHDADEIRSSGTPGKSLAAAIREADEAGFNAVNFLEFTFLPTVESPDHDHPRFQETMRWYYPFEPSHPHRCNAWKRQDEPVELAWSGGHKVKFPGMRMVPESMTMRHYLFLSVPHAVEKFVRRRFSAEEVADGWFEWRSRLRPEDILLPSERDLRTEREGQPLDPTDPRKTHYLADLAGPGGPPGS